MANYPWTTPIARVQVVWSQTQGDIAVNSFYVAAVNDSFVPSVMDVDDLVIVMTTIRDHLEDLTGGDGSFALTCKIDHLDGYVLNAAAPHNAQAKRVVAGTNQPGGGSNALPPECAAVVSLYGYAPDVFVDERRNKRGRSYLPGLSTGAIAGTGLLNTGFYEVVADSYAAMIGALWDAPLSSDLHGDMVIASKTRNYLTSIESVRVDNHVDVQRRRQNAIAYARSTTSVVRD